MYIEAINYCPKGSKPMYPMYQCVPELTPLTHRIVSFIFSVEPDRLDVAYNFIQ